MARQGQDGYQKSSLDKDSNAILRDITGAPLNPAEINQLKQLFNKEPEEQDAPVNVNNKDDLIDKPPLQLIIEQNLTELISANGQTDTSINLDEIIENPQSFIKNYLEKISPNDSQRFKEAIEDITLSLEQQSDFEQETDEESPLDHNVIAFLAIAIGSGEAGRIFRYLDEKDQRATLAGSGDEDDEDNPRVRAARQMATQMMLSNTLRNLNNQITAIDFRLDEIGRRLGKIDQRLDTIGKRLVNIKQETVTLEEKKADRIEEKKQLGTQKKALTKDMVATEQDASKMQKTIDEENAGLAEDLSALPISKDGYPYAKGENGEWRYASGSKQNEIVSKDMRASGWAELDLRRNNPSVKDILKRKIKISIAQLKKEGFDQKAAKIASRLEDVQNKINDNDKETEDIDKKLKKLGIETETLTTEQTKLLLEKGSLTSKQRDLLEKRTGLVNERTKLELSAKGLTAEQSILQEKSAALETSIAAMQAEVTRLEEAQNTAQKNLDEAQTAVETTAEAALNAKTESVIASTGAEEAESMLGKDSDGNALVTREKTSSPFLPDKRFVNVNGSLQRVGFWGSAIMGAKRKIWGETTQEDVDQAQAEAQKVSSDAQQKSNEAETARINEQTSAKTLDITTGKLANARKEIEVLKAQQNKRENSVNNTKDLTNNTSRTGISAASTLDGKGARSYGSSSLTTTHVNAGKPRDTALDVKQPAPFVDPNSLKPVELYTVNSSM